MKIKTIYELFEEYERKEIDQIISSLPQEDKLLIYERYGNDLNNPNPVGNWDESKSKRFYGSLIPKIKRQLQKDTKESKLIIPSFESLEDINQLLELLKKETDTAILCEELKIDNQRLLQKLAELRNLIKKDIIRKYKSDGTINYSLSSSEEEEDKEIIPIDNHLRILAISDLHIGNKQERPDLLYRAFNYCAKEGIHVIMCCGDILDGTYTAGEQNITDVYKQLQRFIELYPKDDSILTFAIGGDHDESVRAKKIDIVSACASYRPDIIVDGYGNDNINVANDTIHLFHRGNVKKLKNSNARIVLRGHSHQFSTAIYGKNLNINVPTLSGITETIPSALDIEIFLNNKRFKSADIKHVYFDSKDMVLSRQEIDLPQIGPKQKTLTKK